MHAQGVTAKLARLALVLRSEQRSIFGAGVSAMDGWEIILILFIADADGQRFTVGEVVEKSGGDVEATRRRVAHLSREGIIVGDGSGQIGDVVTLSPESLTRVEEILERMWSGFTAL